jgi:hypothetical protein
MRSLLSGTRMNKLQIVRQPKAKRASSKTAKVATKRVRTESGEFVTVHMIDANSPTFGDDFLYVFKQNVRKARKENKELLGSPNGVRKAV